MNEAQSGKVLQERLDQFRDAMLAKFYAVEHKHKGDSVTDDSKDWLHFDWQGNDAHFWSEIDELTEASNQGDRIQATKELIDIANMAFLLWWRGSQP